MCVADCLLLETEIYDVYHDEGVGLEVIDYNGWDSASVQSDMKYSYHGQVLDHDFLDAEESDYLAWKGGVSYGQCSLVDPGGIVTWMDNYSIDIPALINAIEDIIYTTGIGSTSLGKLKATFK
ncbi:MAG: hypothetical protein GY771_14945 [bacterium]|nr:hypothetical protein [bacterium]